MDSIEYDESQMLFWWRKAAEQGHTEAKAMLARMSERSRLSTAPEPPTLLKPVSSSIGYDDGLQELIRAANQNDTVTFDKLIDGYDDEASSLTLDGQDLITYLFFQACGSGSTDIAKLLIGRGANVNAKDKDGDAALYLAALNRNSEIVKLLITHGADVNSKGRIATALHASALVGDTESALMLLQANADIEARMPNGDTTSMVAAGHGFAQVLRLLINHGANVNAKDNDGDGALMYAASKGQIETANLLIHNGAEIDSTDFAGETALMQAAVQGRVDVVDFLIANGASVDIEDSSGLTALAWAARRANAPDTDTVIALLNAGANILDLYDNECCLMFYSGMGQYQPIRRRDLNRYSLYELDIISARIYPNSPLYQEVFG